MIGKWFFGWSFLWSLGLGCVLALAAWNASAQPPDAEMERPPLVHAQQRSDVASVQLVSNVVMAAPALALAVVPENVWVNLMGAVAAGLGVTWLASSLGFDGVFAPLWLMALLVVVVLAVVSLWRLRSPKQLNLTSLSATSDPAHPSGKTHSDPMVSPGYNAKNVGNDASARPWEQQADAPALGSAADVADGLLPGSLTGWGAPDGFDTAAFLEMSKANFVSLQVAWDHADIPALRAMMTDHMLEQIKAQLLEREQIQGKASNRTDVVMLEARLLGVEEIGNSYLASVEFSGLISEDASTGPSPFREIWNIARAKSGPDGWLVAGVQALQ